jgi:PDZ domain-containing protein
MRRRGLTVLVGAMLLAVLLTLIAVVKVPYVELGPGPSFDTLGQSENKPIISISGTPTSKSTGQLRLLTVNVVDGLTLVEGLRSWWSKDYAVVPRELIYPPDETTKQVEDRNAEDFKNSQNSAITAALVKLGYPIQVTVKNLSAGLPAFAELQVGDVIVSVDGTTVDSPEKLSELIRSKPVGTARQITYRRGSETKSITLTTAKDPNSGNAVIGVQVENVPPHPFTVTIQLDRIGGPSAGLMFTLGIIDLLKPEDLTGGQTIAGTGTISDDGTVGPIGGVAQKLVAAKAAGAKLFLTPAGNCAEAVANAQPGLPLAKVATVDDALAALEALRQKRTPTLCSR